MVDTLYLPRYEREKKLKSGEKGGGQMKRVVRPKEGKAHQEERKLARPVRGKAQEKERRLRRVEGSKAARMARP